MGNATGKSLRTQTPQQVGVLELRLYNYGVGGGMALVARATRAALGQRGITVPRNRSRRWSRES